MADPYLNIKSNKFFRIHKNRLREHRFSTFQEVTYHLIPKGGIYYLSSTDARIIYI